ncbi:uncharacterized protein RB166_018850 [Leptodactylus fuscus]|uniref:uncharacterized protein LOC142183069 n=1 Tax=Leptodactylus fuscus TaxID=238119 RepID=UPI003F4F3955
METPWLSHSPDSVQSGEGLELEDRQEQGGISQERRQLLGTVLCDEDIADSARSRGSVQAANCIDIEEEPVLSKDTVSYMESFNNMECNPKDDGDFLIPNLQPPRQHLQMQYSSMAGLSKSSSYILQHNKHVLGAKGRRLGESHTDIASTAVASPTYCSKCKKMFATSEAYSRHEPMHMLRIKHYTCIQCGKYYRYNTALVVHRRTHTGEKPYCCNKCGKRFHSRSSLATHGKMHSGEKLYFCSECGTGFAKTDDLFNHQLVHCREKKYTCGDCGKCFKVESELVAHRKCHPMEELFLCSVCGKDFTQYSQLLQHQKTHPRPPPVFVTSEKMLKDQEV